MHVVVILLLLFNITVGVFGDETRYTTKYDNVNFDEILSSERLLKNYVNCLMDRGRCTPDARELKRVLPDALETDCEKCSDVQKNGMSKVIKHLVRNQRQWWDELEARYDPDGKYWTRNKQKLENEGIYLH